VSNVFQKVFTFVVNQIIIRQSSPEVFGIASVQLELLLSTLLFLSREGIRLALLRVNCSDSAKKRQQLVNLSWVPFCVVFLVTVVIYMYCPNIVGGMSRTVVLLYCTGALLECVGEPWFNYYNNAFNLTPRVRADSIAVSARSVFTYLCVVRWDMGVTGFGFAQLMYGASHCITLMAHTWSVPGTQTSLKCFLPRHKVSSSTSLTSMFGPQALGDAVYMTGSSVLKHLLTEADKISLSLTASHYDQGVYAVIHNYGSLVARLLFQPVEETCRIAFSQMASSQKRGDDGTAYSAISILLRGALRLMLLTGAVFPLFGPAYARVVVKVVLGSKWYQEETILALSAFCWYIFSMGVNGVSEAFMQGVAVSGIWSPVNRSLLLSSVCFVLTAPYLVNQYGTVGIISANTLSMSVRIICNVVFIEQYFADANTISPVRECLPSIAEILSAFAVSCCVYMSSTVFASSEMTLKDIAVHLTVGVVLFVFLLGVVFVKHRDEIKSVMSSLVTSKKKQLEDKTKTQ